MCNPFKFFRSFRRDYSKYKNQISFGELAYDKIDNLHNFLRLFKPDAQCVLGDDEITGFLLIYITFHPINDLNELFKNGIENQDPTLNILFKHDYKSATEWVNNLNINKKVRTDLLAKMGLLHEIRTDLSNGKLICCLAMRMPIDDLLKNCFELLRY